MAEYIDKEAAVAKITELINHSGKYTDYECGADDACFIVAHLPAADVRTVVLCRECVHWERYDNTAGCGYCHKVKFEYGADGYVFNPVREPDFYCADGRKADV